ncbi:triacylglycerol lipase 2-like [Senna tora]|uniref:Lipase n=1 Tax=Senna tora TaxID=362788 RepID=A0A834SE63_9FABA|nr:triacylglycerol lipase 2-like [Senna tora]
MEGKLGFGALILFCFIAILATQVDGALASFFPRKSASSSSPPDGICASSVIIHGYKCQELQVTTKDGYILSLQRIPQGRAEVGGSGANKKQPVIIQHGLIVDGLTWLINGPEQNLPLILADNGYDVWIANTRGTSYSRRHVSLDPSTPAYWNWSWDELVSYDLPAVFDYVYSQTGQKINYVGHSLGTLIALASFSEGNLVNQLKSAALLSPIAYLSHMKTALGVVAAKSFVGEITTILGVAEFNPKGNEPQATSTKTMVHLAQTVRRGILSKFNYERPDYNLMHYGEELPPIYNLSNIPHNLPLFISYGGQDALSDVLDVGNLLDILRSHDVDKLSVQFVKNYAHADFIMGFNAKDIVYNAVLAFFKRQFA